MGNPLSNKLTEKRNGNAMKKQAPGDSIPAMKPHPEGGKYSEPCILGDGLVSHIYYLIPAGGSCAPHRVTGEEIWLLHSGGPLTLFEGGDGSVPCLEQKSVLTAEHKAHTVPENTWQWAEAETEAFVSCVVCPAFCYDNWELFEEEIK